MENGKFKDKEIITEVESGKKASNVTKKYGVPRNAIST